MPVPVVECPPFLASCRRVEETILGPGAANTSPGAFAPFCSLSSSPRSPARSSCPHSGPARRRWSPTTHFAPRLGSCVFTAAVREAYLAPTHAEATAVSAARTGKGLSQQAWRLGPKVLEVEGWIRATGRRVVEVHPELSFSRMAGAAVLASKKSWEGYERRRALLHAEGIGPPRDHGAGAQAAPDDVLDAEAAAWTARRYAEGRATSLPDPPEVVENGALAAIWS